MSKQSDLSSLIELIAVLLFALTCLQAAFLKPYIVLVAGERSNLFTGLLCAVSLLAACCLRRGQWKAWRSPEFLVSAVLLIFAVLSSAFSSSPRVASFRAFVVMASGLGGFWCARALFNNPERRLRLTWFCFSMLGVALLLGIVGRITAGRTEHLMDVNPHPFASRIMLLSFAPLVLLHGTRRSVKPAAALMLCIVYVVLYLSTLRSAVLIPLLLVVPAYLIGSLRPRHFLLTLALFLGATACFFYHCPGKRLQLEGYYEPVRYRVESYPFSWHIAKRNPLLGIGLRAPRDQYLEDYEVKSVCGAEAELAGSVRHVVTFENVFLTFMTDLGFPFALLYTAALAFLLTRLTRMAMRRDLACAIAPAALLLPLTAAILHFLVFDGLLHPHVSWFFHVLLGLIPPAGPEVPGRRPASRR